MNEFKTILKKLKEIIKRELKTDKKVLDKDIAIALNIKPSSLASFKRRDKPPYQAILTYCHNNRLDVRKLLFNEDTPLIVYPATEPVTVGRVRIKYFRTLDAYSHYLGLQLEA